MNDNEIIVSTVLCILLSYVANENGIRFMFRQLNMDKMIFFIRHQPTADLHILPISGRMAACLLRETRDHIDQTIRRIIINVLPEFSNHPDGKSFF